MMGFANLFVEPYLYTAESRSQKGKKPKEALQYKNI
jgi:hypothetical protein